MRHGIIIAKYLHGYKNINSFTQAIDLDTGCSGIIDIGIDGSEQAACAHPGAIHQEPDNLLIQSWLY